MRVSDIDLAIKATLAEIASRRATRRRGSPEPTAEMHKLFGSLARLKAERLRLMDHEISKQA